MDFEKELAKLNQMPEDAQIKQKIRSSIDMQATPKKRGGAWKEIAVIMAICSISFFLVLTGTSNKKQATSNEIEHIYTYFGGEENEFWARTSTLYSGVQEIMNPTTIAFFNQIDQMEELEKGYLDNYIVDVIVVRNNKEHRYQLSSVSLYDVDNGIYYKGEGTLFSEAFDMLYDPPINSLTTLVAIGVIIINLLEWGYYKRRKMKRENLLADKWGYIAISLIILVCTVAYSAFIGPLYKPALMVMALLYGYALWKLVQRHANSYIVLRVETYKVIGMTILLLVFIFTL